MASSKVEASAWLSTIVLLLWALFWPLNALAQQKGDSSTWNYAVPNAVKVGLDNKDHALVASAFGQSVELRLPNASGIYSKKQAEMILAEFLSLHKKMSFQVDHEEVNSGTALTIGNLFVDSTVMKVYILSQSINSTYRIKQFRIEEQK